MDLGDALQQILDSMRIRNCRPGKRRSDGPSHECLDNSAAGNFSYLLTHGFQQGRIRYIRPQFLNRKDDEALRLIRR